METSATLIVGGTGSLGRAVTRRLLARGTPVRIMTRTPDRAADLVAEGVEIVSGNLLDRSSLERACRGAGAVVGAAHAIFGRGREASTHVDGRGHRDLIDAAVAAGARRFVYTSLFDNGPAYHEVPFVRIKYEVEQHLKASGLPYTILRPTAFMEVHAHLLIGEPILRNGKVVLFGRGEQPRNFVAADDVAQIAVRALDDPDLEGQTVDIGGPENLSNSEVVRLYEQVAGRPAKVTHVPLGLLRVMVPVLRPVQPGLSQVMQMSILADTLGQAFDAQPLQQRFGIAFSRLEDWISRTVKDPALAR